MKYKDYLQTDHWKLLKSFKTNKRCAICASPTNLDTHHLIYKNLFNVQPADLRKLCRRCHFLAHDLFKQGKIIFHSTNHHSRFSIIKVAVKKSLGLTHVNMFISALPIQSNGSIGDRKPEATTEL